LNMSPFRIDLKGRAVSRATKSHPPAKAAV
jgi:hypothetical protein